MKTAQLYVDSFGDERVVFEAGKSFKYFTEAGNVKRFRTLDALEKHLNKQGFLYVKTVQHSGLI